MTMIEQFPGVRREPFRPADEYERWREEGPIRRVRLENGQETWVVLRRNQAQEILGQTESLSSDATAPGFPHFRAGAPSGSTTTQMVRMNPPLHGKYRKILATFFTAKKIASCKPELRQFTEDAIYAMLERGAPADFHESVALVIPSKAICLFLGVDYSLHTEFERLSRPVASALVSAEVRNRSITELYKLMSEIFDAQRTKPRDGVISKLLKLVDEGEMPYEAALSNAFLILLGGHETTAHSISLGVVQLLKNPHLMRAVREDPGKMPLLVEEMLRTQGIAETVVTRAVTKPIRVGDQVIEPGEGITVPASSSNHDPDAFANPHEIDLDRDLSEGHMAFGGGIHSCLGQTLARTEMMIAFEAVMRLIPNLRLDENEGIEYQRDPFLFGMRRLPVTW
jgi:cytochrome P450